MEPDPKISSISMGDSGDGKDMGMKRARGSGSQRAFCLVDGCESDLSKCKDYHRRHKVCEAHSKTPVVLVGGQQQRFCQQCSRFHSLGEFDEVKRSCRKRLDGHNKRRRKPQPSSASGGLIPSSHGSGFYSCPQAFPCDVAGYPKCLSIGKNGENSLFKSHPVLHFNGGEQGSISSNYRGKQFPFLQDNGVTTLNTRTAVESSSFQSLDTISSSECGINGNHEIFPTSSTQVSNSSSAPSLLSSSTQTSTVNQYHTIPASNQIPFGQPYTSLSKYPHSQTPDHVSSTAFSFGVDNENAGAVLVPNANGIDLSSPGIFHVDRGRSPDGPLHAVPFSWS